MNKDEAETVAEALEKLETATEMDMMTQGPGIQKMAVEAKDKLESLDLSVKSNE